MNEPREDLAKRYAAALHHYLAGSGEPGLREAYELGRHALSTDLGVLELVAIHQKCLFDMVGDAPTPGRLAPLLQLAADFLSESLSPYEMVQRGFRETNERLSRSLKDLRSVEDALRRRHDDLAAAHLAAEAERLRYLELFNSAPDGYLVCRLDGIIKEANAAAASLLATPAESLTGRSLFSFVAESDLQAVRALLDRIRTEAPERAEYLQVSLVRSGGEALDAGISIAGERSGDGNLIGWRWSIRDIGDRLRDERERAALEVRERVARAEADVAATASRAKDEFLAILSHELRNPLMPVLGWARILKNHPLVVQDATLSEGVHSLERNAHTISRLVEDCLDLVRISQGRIRLDRAQVDLNQVMLAPVEAIRPLASLKGVSFVVRLSGEGLLIHADPTRLEQVFMNLLTNAVKYTQSGGVVSLGSRLVDGEAEIEVTDNGIGIAPEFLGQVFEPFRQGTTDWLTRESGLGIGLAISRRIVDVHDGRIWAESEGFGRGATFRIRLPLACADENPQKPVPLPPRVPVVNPLTVLVIEDARDILFLLKSELEWLGYRVLTATDGVSGLALASTERPDIIVSDIKMPSVNGLQLIRRIRAAPELAPTPAIALTGFGMKKDVEAALAAGFDACLTKPSETSELSDLIQKLAVGRARRPRPFE